MRISVVIFLLASTFETFMGVAEPPQPPQIESPPPQSRDAGNPFVERLKPVLSSDLPQIGKAAFEGDVVTLRRLILLGANLEETGRDGRTALILAAAGGNLETVSALLAAGAKIDTRDITGATALHWAAQRGDEKIALVLLSHHPQVNGQDSRGATPIILAAIAGDS